MYARGGETLGGSSDVLDLTALGRQEDWEEPKGRATTDARRASPTSRRDPSVCGALFRVVRSRGTILAP